MPMVNGEYWSDKELQEWRVGRERYNKVYKDPIANMKYWEFSPRKSKQELDDELTEREERRHKETLKAISDNGFGGVWSGLLIAVVVLWFLGYLS